MDAHTNEPQESQGYKVLNISAQSLPQELRNVIMGPFLNSLRYGNDLFKLIDKEAYYQSYAKYIEALLHRPQVYLRFAMLDDVVLGWCMIENNSVHYIWVKKEVRRQGIGWALLPKTFDTITHITNKGMSIWANKFKDVRFNPF